MIRTLSGRRPRRRIKQKENVMKVLSVFAVVLSLLGAANVAMAQGDRGGLVTGSLSNAYEHQTGTYGYGR